MHKLCKNALNMYAPLNCEFSLNMPHAPKGSSGTPLPKSKGSNPPPHPRVPQAGVIGVHMGTYGSQNGSTDR